MKRTAKLYQARELMEFLLGIDRDFHNDLIYRIGSQWLETYFARCPYNIKKWESSRTYWRWWLMNWDVRNFEVLMQLGYSLDEKKEPTEVELDALLEAFETKHKMAVKIYPGHEIIERIQLEYDDKVLDAILEGTGVITHKQHTYGIKQSKR